MPEFARNMAFVIGINNYQNGISPLQNAVNDAKKLIEILREKHKYQVWVCLDEIATLSNLNNLLEQTLPRQIQRDDRLLFYFAGHGTIDGEGDDGPTGYLIPQDARRGDLKSYLPMTQLYESLNKLPCRHFLGIFDCCYAGAFRWLTTRDLLKAPEKIYRQRYDRYIKDPAWQIIASAAYDQKALDVDPFAFERGQIGNNSVFAAVLLEALQGKAEDDPFKEGVITANKLYSYLRDRIEPITEAKGQRQTPSLIELRRHDKGEYIFLTPGHRLNLEDAPPLNEKNNPYKGLQSFEEEDSQLFFGRQALREQLYSRITQQPLTIVLGASGSGKSSLVKAGLIPDLKEKNPDWHILAPIRPGESPFGSLRNAFAKDKFPSVAAVTTLESEEKIESLLASLDDWFKLPKNSNLLIVIDQAEELITLCQDEQEREAFLRLLARALENYRQLRIVFTLRSDFETQIRNLALEPYWQAKGARFFVEDMSREELRSCIEEPASKKVIFFEPHNLVEKLIDEVYRMPGALPLLSFTLSELYLKYLRSVREQGRDNRAIAQTDYQELGGILGSITKRADEEYEKLVEKDKAYELTIRNVMLRMIAVGDGELARRRVPEIELLYPEPENSRVKNVINQFVDARLLVKNKDDEGESYVEPAHDALISRWEKILAWKKEKQENLILQRRLTPAAFEWKSQQKAKFLWNADPRLDLLKKLLNSNDNWFNKLETEFVQRSLSLREKNRRIRMGLVVTVFSIVSVFAFIQWKQNQEAQSINLATSSKTIFGSDQQLEALIEVIKAGKKLKGVVLPEADTTHQVVTALHQLVYDSTEYNRLPGEEGFLTASFSPDGKMLTSVSQDGIIQLWSIDGKKGKTLNSNLKSEDLGHWKNSIGFSPDGKMLALGSNNGIIQLWNLDSNKVETFTTNLKSVNSISFSPDGKVLASASQDGIIQLWNLDSNQVKTFTSRNVDSISFSPDGKMLALGSNNGIIQLWNLDSNEVKTLTSLESNISFSPDSTMLASDSGGIIQLWNTQTGEKIGRELKGDSSWVGGVSFSRDGKMLASGGYDGIIKVWATQTGKELWSIQGSRGLTGASIMDISFSPDGKILASVDNDKFIKLWKLDNENKPRTLQGQLLEINSVSFSPNGKMLALAGEDDNFIELWNLDGEDKPRKLKGQLSQINSVSFSPDGKMLALAGENDNFIELWNLDSEDKPRKLKGHSSGVNNISFSPDAKMLASAGNDGTIKLWSLDSNKEPRILKGHENMVNSVNFSPDGKMLASASKDHTVKLWSLENNKKVWSQKIGSGSGGMNYRVTFSPDGKTLASVSEYNLITLWSLDGQEIRRIKGDFSNINSIAFSPDGKMLALVETSDSLGEVNDSIIRLLNLDGRELGRLKSPLSNINSISFSPDGKILASAGENGTVILWNLDLDDLLRRGCDLIHDYLQNNPNVSESDRTLCDDVPKVVEKDKSF